MLGCLLTAGVLLGAAPAGAATVPTAVGTWSCCGSGGAGAQTWVITSAKGKLSGTGYEGNTPFSPISGSTSGTSVTIVTGPYTSDPGYTATFVGTLSASGTSMSGTWTSNQRQSGTWTATRTAGSPTTSTGPKTKEEEEKASKKKHKALLPTSMIVNCNLESPDTPFAFFECTTEVFNASLTEPLPVPTGSVSFAVNPGGSGGFKGVNVCLLKASELGGNSAFCSVDYTPPAEGIPIGSQPPITGTYSGNSTFASSNAQPRSPLPQVPQASAQQSGSSVQLQMSCPAQTPCSGTVQMVASGAQAASLHAVAAGSALVASGGYSIAAHSRAVVKLRLTSRGKALLKKHKHHLILTLKILPKTGSPAHKAIVLK